MSDNAKQLYIIGASGFGREVADTVRAINKFAGSSYFKLIGFIDDDVEKQGKLIDDVPVICDVEEFGRRIQNEELAHRPSAVIAIADPHVKELIAEKLGDVVEWPNIIHPSAQISKFSQMGVGNIVQSGVGISSGVTIGNHCCINAGSSGVGHDAVLGDFVSVMSHCDITGCCKLENKVYVATSACIIPGITIGEGAFLGAGSVVVKDVNAGTRVFGNPARRVD